MRWYAKILGLVLGLLYAIVATVGFLPCTFDKTTLEAKPSKWMNVYSVTWSICRIVSGPPSIIYTTLAQDLWRVKLVATMILYVGLFLTYIVTAVATLLYHVHMKEMLKLYSEMVIVIRRDMSRFTTGYALKYAALVACSVFLYTLPFIFVVLMQDNIVKKKAAPKAMSYWYWIRMHNNGFFIIFVALHAALILIFAQFVRVLNEDIITTLEKLNQQTYMQTKILPDETEIRNLTKRYVYIYSTYTKAHHFFEVQMVLFFMFIYVNTSAGFFNYYYIHMHYTSLGDASLANVQRVQLTMSAVQFASMVLVFYANQELLDEALRTRGILETFSYNGKDRRIKLRIEKFVQLLGVVEYKFSYCGLFTAHLSDLFDFTTSVIMTIIVLVQFDDGESFLARKSMADLFGNVTLS